MRKLHGMMGEITLLLSVSILEMSQIEIYICIILYGDTQNRAMHNSLYFILFAMPQKDVLVLPAHDFYEFIFNIFVIYL